MRLLARQLIVQGDDFAIYPGCVIVDLFALQRSLRQRMQP